MNKTQDPQCLGGSNSSYSFQSLPAAGTTARGSSRPITSTQCHSHTGDNRADSPDLGVIAEVQAHFLPPHLGNTKRRDKTGTRSRLCCVQLSVARNVTADQVQCIGMDFSRYTIKKHSVAPPGSFSNSLRAKLRESLLQTQTQFS